MIRKILFVGSLLSCSAMAQVSEPDWPAVEEETLRWGNLVGDRGLFEAIFLWEMGWNFLGSSSLIFLLENCNTLLHDPR